MRIAQLNTLKKPVVCSRKAFLKIHAPSTHSSVETTQVYAKIVDKLTENPARYLEAMLTG